MKLPLEAPTYSCLCKRSAELEIKFRNKVRATGFIDIVVDSTGLKVFGEGEWHAQKHHVKARRKWRKLHLAVDANTHDIVGAQMTLSNVTDGETL
ncbi:transposase, partial [Pseudoalteromonas rubra]